jgi:hypothetical protein
MEAGRGQASRKPREETEHAGAMGRVEVESGRARSSGWTGAGARRRPRAADEQSRRELHELGEHGRTSEPGSSAARASMGEARDDVYREPLAVQPPEVGVQVDPLRLLTDVSQQRRPAAHGKGACCFILAE